MFDYNPYYKIFQFGRNFSQKCLDWIYGIGHENINFIFGLRPLEMFKDSMRMSLENLEAKKKEIIPENITVESTEYAERAVFINGYDVTAVVLIILTHMCGFAQFLPSKNRENWDFYVVKTRIQDCFESSKN